MFTVPNAFLSLGSNLGDRAKNLADAAKRIERFALVQKRSSLYETEPVGVREQPWFLNCVLQIETELEPVELLHALLNVERAMGRERNVPKGPRNIDIDLLLYDDQIINTAELTLPHPAMHERRFALQPLAEIAPGALHPTLRKTAFQLLKTLAQGEQVRRIEE